MGIDKDNLRQRVFLLVDAGGSNVASTLTAEFGISRQAINAHLSRMVESGVIASQGATKSKTYSLVEQVRVTESYQREGLAEDRVWRELCAPVVKDLGENVREIWHYGMTEMINNAIDHSGSSIVHVGMSRNALYTRAWVSDEGEGIFLKVQKALGLYDPRESILELAKGKFTTDPENHTGEGIFFASKMFDAYDIQSGNLHFMHDDGQMDLLVERAKDAAGTLVLMKLANGSQRTLKDVFDKFAAPDEYSFDRTIVPVRLAQYEGEKLVSRSQAKRLTMRFERFKIVVLDFSGVETIGQAFADEVFRVFQTAHPTTKLVPNHMTQPVEDMVKRALAGA